MLSWTYATLFTSLLSSLISGTNAQDVAYDATHNVTSLLGTWSSGSGAVRTGVGFANPVNFTFTYPNTTGISYSFTVDRLSDGSDGYFEEAQYRFTGNASQPTCIVGVVQWQHGTYTLNTNGSITLNPFAADGRQQVQDMCAAKSNVISQFNQTTLFAGWGITQDVAKGPKLQLLRFDGALLSPMYQLSATPNMLPTQTLTNETAGAVAPASSGSRTLEFAFGPVVGLSVAMGFAAILL